MSYHAAGHVIRETIKKVGEERAQGRNKSAFGLGMIGLSIVLVPFTGPLALIPFVIGVTACCCQEKVGA